MKASLYNTEINATASGASSSILIDDGRWNFFLRSDSWGLAFLQSSSDNVDWNNLKSLHSGVYSEVVMNGNTEFQADGAGYFRLYVHDPGSGINLIAKK